MIVKLVRVIHAEIGNKSLEDFRKGIQAEDESTEGTVCETEFDEEGKVITYVVHKMVTTVEEDTSGEFKGTISVDPISEELTVKSFNESDFGKD